jgi:Transposase DDE domain
MRHGRKSATQRIDGYKRYICNDLEKGLILAATVQPANVAEHRGADAMRAELAPYGEMAAAHIDRAFLPSALVGELDEAGGEVVAKPYPDRTQDGYSKRAFAIDLDQKKVTCPAGKVAPIEGEHARFRRADCMPCLQRTHCQKPGARHPRVIQIHPREALLQKLVHRRATPEGRAAARKRTAIEHALAHVVFRQGDRARYIGARKNEYDLRRASAITNLQTIDRAERLAAAA